MPDIGNILNNTILIPYHDSLVDSKPLEAYNPADKIENINADEISSESFEYGAYIKIKDNNSVKMIAVQEVTGFGMQRENTQRPTSSGNYVINLPGAVTYSDIKIKHIYSKDKFFLDWLTNGISQGGSARVDMELHFTLPVVPKDGDNKKKKQIVFTLYDAFPVGWEIDPLQISGGKTLIETIKITFSSMQYSAMN